MKAVVFDAYGTLFNVFSVTGRCETLFPGHGKQLADVWRKKQLEYSWLRSLMGRYRDFWAVTEDALVYSAKSLNLEITAGDRARLAAARRYKRVDGIATECGMARGDPGRFPALLAAHTRAAELRV